MPAPRSGAAGLAALSGRLCAFFQQSDNLTNFNFLAGIDLDLQFARTAPPVFR